MSWAPRDVKLLEKLWKEGLSASQIAGKLTNGASRSAVLGKVNRMGLSYRKFPEPRRERYESATTGVKFTGRHVSKVRAAKFAKEPLPPTEPAPGTAISLSDLEPHHCRWPYGHVGASDFGFCGQTRSVGSYCDLHMKKAYSASYVACQSRSDNEVNARIAKAKKISEGVE